MQESNLDTIICKNQTHPHPHGTISGDDHLTPTSTELQKVLEADGQTFAGELSMSPAFKGLDESQDHVNGTSTKLLSEFASGPALQHSESSGNRADRKVRGWLESVLDRHDVVADEEEWRRYMRIFLDEIHILYPILHPPTVWEIFNELWEYSALWSMANSAEREHKRMSVALVCFCLALGRCSVSTRMTDADGAHSAGWSLYSVGMSLMQDTMEMSNTAATSLLTLQILLIRVRPATILDRDHCELRNTNCDLGAVLVPLGCNSASNSPFSRRCFKRTYCWYA